MTGVKKDTIRSYLRSSVLLHEEWEISIVKISPGRLMFDIIIICRVLCAVTRHSAEFLNESLSLKHQPARGDFAYVCVHVCMHTATPYCVMIYYLFISWKT